MLDFSLNMYASFLREAAVLGYAPLTVAGWCAGQRPARYLVLRHDVDRFPGHALRMARLEQMLHVASTYYFRAAPRIFVPDVVREIESLGHEVGYHYEVLAEARGNTQKARALFGLHVREFRKHCRVSTAAMHGRPLSPYTETDFWNYATLDDYGLRGEAYLSFAHASVPYFTDTGRTWSDTACNFRDRLVTQEQAGFDGNVGAKQISTTDELMGFMRRHTPAALYVSFHPERWPAGMAGYAVSLGMDKAANFVKKALKKYNELRANLA